MAEPIQTVAVIGSGVIGSSWAALFLARGLKVILSDPIEGAAETFESFLQQVWPTLQRIGLSEGASLDNYEFVDDIHPRLEEVDFVQENGPEKPDVKTHMVGKIDAHARPDTVIASSSSGIPSSQFISQCRKNPGRILIGHPFNPPHLVPLVEVVPNSSTTSTSTQNALAFYRSLGKQPILLNQEVPGFVANRLQAALNNEAYSLISRGIVSAQDLDAAVTTGLGLRWCLNGPIFTNALGGGGGKDGFTNRLDRLGVAIQGWEKDVLDHRFDWSSEKLEKLKQAAKEYLEEVDSPKVVEQRDRVLLQVLEAKLNESLLV